MDFNFTEEQNMIRDSLSRLIREQYDFDTRRKVVESEAGWRPEKPPHHGGHPKPSSIVSADLAIVLREDSLHVIGQHFLQHQITGR